MGYILQTLLFYLQYHSVPILEQKASLKIKTPVPRPLPPSRGSNSSNVAVIEKITVLMSAISRHVRQCNFLNAKLFSALRFESREVLLDGIGEFGEHGLAADLHLVVPNTNKNLRLERIWENVGVALHLGFQGYSEAVEGDNRQKTKQNTSEKPTLTSVRVKLRA